MRRDRARIGLLWPADGRNDREFWRWLPEQVTLLIARYDVGGTLDLEQLQRDADQDRIVGAGKLLRHVAPDVITLGDCAGSFVGGKTVNLEQSRAVEEATGIHTISMSTALVAAIAHLRTDRVAVLSPYAPEVTQRLHGFLGEHEITVEQGRSIDRASEVEIDAMTADDWRREAQQADCGRAEALVVAGGGVSLSTIITQLEADLSKPVISGPGALMWAALDNLQVAYCIDGRGSLFGEKR